MIGVIKKILFGGFYSEDHGHSRPLWKILLLLPLFVIYWPSKVFVDFCDRNF